MYLASNGLILALLAVSLAEAFDHNSSAHSGWYLFATTNLIYAFGEIQRRRRLERTQAAHFGASF